MSEVYVLELEHIRKEYPGVTALADVTLQLRRGEILGLIGENGAGKSTLIKCCSGAVIPTSGKIKINGKEFDRMTPQLAAENGIAIIYQEFNNVKELSAAENLFLGRPIRKGVMIDKKAMEEKAKEAFDQLRIKINPNDIPAGDILRTRTATLRITVPASEQGGGLAIYGKDFGRYPLDPSIVLKY